jgi:iron complex outermembrane recepter protein
MRTIFALSALIVVSLAAPAAAAPSYNFNIPAQRLDNALIALSGETQISIGGIDPLLAHVRSNAVHGKFSVRKALTAMLQNTGFTYEQIDGSTFRVIRAKPKVVVPKPAKAPILKVALKLTVSTSPTPPSPPEQEIVVTASKQYQALDRYPGTVTVEQIGSAGIKENMGTAALVSRIPSIASTNLGPGRNKLFVRGIADSSFSGPTQSTVGLYLGEQRITYNAPEPDLRLYDIDRVEVIEGPQGTLYGAGTLGGVIRIMPKVADMDTFHGSLSSGASLTKGGANGFDLAAMANVPVVSDRAAIRIVGYRQTEGGYIDNATLATHNTNRTRIIGGRANLRIRAGNDWTISLGASAQNIDTADGQYAELGRPPLTHAANIAQPHDNDFKAINLDVSKNWGPLKLVSTTGYVLHELSETFDATGPLGQPSILAYIGRNNIRLFAHETRISRNSSDGGSWVAGVSALHNADQINRSLGPINTSSTLAELRNIKTEIAVFGEATRPLAAQLSGTIGGRLIYASTLGELSNTSASEFEPRHTQIRLLPTFAVSWRPVSGTIAFLRYQSGFRSGGIAIDGTALNSVQRFAPDTIQTIELGARVGGVTAGSSAEFSGGLTGFASRWSHIQADLINNSGLQYTANIGQGMIYGIEANGRWRMTDALSLVGAIFVNQSALTDPASSFEEASQLALPNVAKIGGRVELEWTKPLSATVNIKFDGTIRYVGASRLGTAPPLVLEHGETLQTELSLALDFGRWSLALEATNLMNRTGNSFSYGNPFTVANGQQITPLRPRNLRLGARFAF